jgi:hypothetical protein
MKKINLVILFCLLVQFAFSQALDYHNVITVILNDGTQVVLYGKAGEDRIEKYVGGIQLSDDYDYGVRHYINASANNTNTTIDFGTSHRLKLNSGLAPIKYLDDYYFTGEYFYLPTNLRLSKRNDGKNTPEFLFMKYTTEQRTDAGGAQGAIMHFLMEWGLTPEQEKEAQEKLRLKIKDLKASAVFNSKFDRVVPEKAVIAGPAKLNSAGENSFRIISAILNDKSTAPSMVCSGQSPALPGQKVAVAAKLDKYGAQLLAATFEKNRSITDVSLELRFKYKVLMPGIKGQMRIDWESVQKVLEDNSKAKAKIDLNGVKTESNIDLNAFMDQAINSKAVEITITDYGGNDKDDLRKSVLEAFMSSFSSAISSAGEEKDDTDENNTPNNTPPAANDYSTIDAKLVSVRKFKSRMRKGIEVINLNYRMATTEEAVLTENLGAWYDGVRNNKACVSTVNLNDPFFSHRDIYFILDNKVKDVFENEVNYVTVNVRKKRSSGNPFQEQITIDNKYLKDNGARASLTYARGEDKNPDMYEYKSQWSLRGGKLFPENPEWVKGDWQGVQLSCPMVPRTIQFEADLEELKQMGIVRATLQLRYMKYGVERESNIPMTVSQGKALVEEKLFIDEDTPGYAYRLVLTHKEKGKVALDWDTKLNDDYVYAIIPKKLKEGDDVIWKKVLDAAKVITEPDANGVVKLQDRILDRFIKVLKVVTGQK